MDLTEISKLVGSGAGVAALITSVYNIVTIHNQQKRLLEIEVVKKNFAIESFRYTKIFEAHTEIKNFPPVHYDLNNMERLVGESSDRYGKVKAVFSRISPLLEISHSVLPKNTLSEEETLSNGLVNHLYGSGPEVMLRDLLSKRLEAEKNIVAALSLSLTFLTMTMVL